MRRTSAVLASIHAVEPVSIFTQVSFAALPHRLGSADFAGCADGFRFCENKEPYVSSAFHGAENAAAAGASTLLVRISDERVRKKTARCRTAARPHGPALGRQLAVGELWRVADPVVQDHEGHDVVDVREQVGQVGRHRVAYGG